MECSLDQQRPRILLRELRRRTRQPKRHDSLPSLRLVPENRLLYVCQRCQFTNVLSKLCPWCFSTCDTVAALVAVVHRRLSSPNLLNEAQKMQLARIEKVACSTPSGGAHFLFMATSSGPHPTRDLPAGASQVQPETETDRDHVRRRHRNAVLYSATDVVATATSDTTLQPFLDQIAAAQQENRERERRSVFSDSTITTPTPSVRTTRPASSQTLRSVSPPALRPTLVTPQTPRTPTPARTRIRMSSQDVDLTHTSEPRSSAELSAPSSPSLSPTPCLRRKRRMSVLRQRSSCSLRRRATTSSTESFCREGAISPSSPRPKTATSFTSTSPPGSPPRAKSPTSIRFSTPLPGAMPKDKDITGSANNIPLGHPQRPLYTAIRKNMSRPGSPSPPPTGARPNFDAAFQTLVYERQTRSLDIPTPRYGSLSRASQLAISSEYARPALFPIATRSGHGFSVSGETELRMDLARSRSVDGVPSDFAFQEVRRQDRDASMKTKVKNLGKTIKSFLRVKV
ncbi:hypothetical protein C8Q74DRAFT_1197045 [Fomes fomentarius]|nr:hypothetical protein C8Q74DRAFT_1197045 [Fomes fomentarius]